MFALKLSDFQISQGQFPLRLMFAPVGQVKALDLGVPSHWWQDSSPSSRWCGRSVEPCRSKEGQELYKEAKEIYDSRRAVLD